MSAPAKWVAPIYELDELGQEVAIERFRWESVRTDERDLAYSALYASEPLERRWARERCLEIIAHNQAQGET